MNQIKKSLEKFTLFLHKKYKITPDVLTYIRMFAAPWLALLILKILSSKSLTLTIITLFLYAVIISTDFLDGILARAISKKEEQTNSYGAMLDRMADKILMIFLLIPFGLNLFTFLIISAESILIFQILFSPLGEKQSTNTGKIKMVLQTFLIPILILNIVTNLIPDIALYAYIIATIIYTYLSVYSHYSEYFYFKND